MYAFFSNQLIVDDINYILIGFHSNHYQFNVWNCINFLNIEKTRTNIDAYDAYDVYDGPICRYLE